MFRESTHETQHVSSDHVNLKNDYWDHWHLRDEHNVDNSTPWQSSFAFACDHSGDAYHVRDDWEELQTTDEPEVLATFDGLESGAGQADEVLST